jgi:hypothetical protein
VADLQECEEALDRLAGALNRVDPQVRRARLPARRLSLHVPDLGAAWEAVIDGDGLHDLRAVEVRCAARAEVRFTAPSDQVVAVADAPSRFLSAWLRGRVTVAARARDLMELRRLL